MNELSTTLPRIAGSPGTADAGRGTGPDPASAASRRGLTRSEPVVAGLRTPLLQAGDPQADEAVVFVHGNPGSADKPAAGFD